MFDDAESEIQFRGSRTRDSDNLSVVAPSLGLGPGLETTAVTWFLNHFFRLKFPPEL